MTRNGGSLADPGSVSYLFNRKGVVIVPAEQEGKRVDRGRRARGDARRRRRGGQRPRRVLRGGLRGRPTWSPSAPRCRTPASTTTPPRPRFVPSMQVELDAGRRRQGVPADRRARGPRRRAERLRQLRRLRRGDGSRSTPDPPGASHPLRRGERSGLAWCEQVFGRRQGVLMRVLGIDPGLTRCGVGRGRGLRRPAADAGRRRAWSAPPPTCRSSSGCCLIEAGPRGVARRAPGPTRSPSSGSSASTTSGP